MASANAIPRIMLVWITGCASGLRPSASIALPVSMPMASAGARPPSPMAMPAPMYLRPVSVKASSGKSAEMSKSCLLLLRPRVGHLCVSLNPPRGIGTSVQRRHLDRLVLAVLLVGADGEDGEDERQHSEHERLDEPDEDLEPVERQRHQEGQQERHHEQQDLAGEHVAEEPEGEADQAGDLGDELQHADEHVDWAAEVDELARVLEEAEGGDAPELDEDHRHDRDGERRVDVRIHAAEVGLDDAQLLVVLVQVVDRLVRVADETGGALVVSRRARARTRPGDRDVLLLLELLDDRQRALALDARVVPGLVLRRAAVERVARRLIDVELDRLLVRGDERDAG